MQIAKYEGEFFNLHSYLQKVSDKEQELDRLIKRSDKGAYICPYCNKTLFVRRSKNQAFTEHFSHRYGESCLLHDSYGTYSKQIKNETKNHSAIKEIIYDELKQHEKTNEDIDVNYGYISKVEEKWKYYPDIILKKDGNELAISIITNVSYRKDRKYMDEIARRNTYYQEKGTKTVWFVETNELSVDLQKRVIHLWETELNLALKTGEDLLWQEMLNMWDSKYHLFDLFNFHCPKLPDKLDVRSLYYVRSTDTEISFQVHHFILTEVQYPYRGFILNRGYDVSLAKALSIQDSIYSIQLSDPEYEAKERGEFWELAAKKEKIREEELELRKQQLKNHKQSTHEWLNKGKIKFLNKHKEEVNETPLEMEEGIFSGSSAIRTKVEMSSDLRKDIGWLESDHARKKKKQIHQSVLEHLRKQYGGDGEVQSMYPTDKLSSVSVEDKIMDKRKKERIEKITNHFITGETYINGSPRKWKEYVLFRFNMIQRQEVSLLELIKSMKENGFTFNQNEKLVAHAVSDFLRYISREVKQDIQI